MFGNYLKKSLASDRNGIIVLYAKELKDVGHQSVGYRLKHFSAFNFLCIYKIKRLGEKKLKSSFNYF